MRRGGGIALDGIAATSSTHITVDLHAHALSDCLACVRRHRDSDGSRILSRTGASAHSCLAHALLTPRTDELARRRPIV